MKEDLIGEQVTVSGPPDAIVVLACEAAIGMAACADLPSMEAEGIAAALQRVLDQLGPADVIEARIVLVHGGVDAEITAGGGEPATVEYRA